MSRRKDLQPEAPSDAAQVTGPATTGTPVDEPVATQPFVAEVDTPPAPHVEDAPRPLPHTPPPPSPGRPGVFAPLLGGALAAIGGFALSHFNLLGLANPAAPVDLAPLVAQIDAAKTAQAAAVDALATRVDALESAPAPDLARLDTLEQRLAAIEAMPSDGSASTATLTAKVTDLEQRFAALPTGGADPALQQKLDDALARLGKAEAEATSRVAKAEDVAAKAARDTALTALSDAIATGQPFATELQALSDPKLSETLGPLAVSGVPTLATLQATFPDAARAALAVARDLSVDTGWSDRLVDFLAAQTGARPVTPQQGDAPDAVLSRAEFALSEGRVDDALTELAPLDPAVMSPLDAWIAQAKAHVAASVALQSARGE
jgi:hypothetical protein